ncbi:MAG: hypothetical protein PHI28_10295, partial [Mangrovibacterium sp.]|nr:hypothetical protein [Mangrovibacterium sp.]
MNNILFFKCTLLSDVIINQTAGTEGVRQTLDFIPGNAFLGIAAAELYNDPADSMLLFHSGKVRFGDAHPFFLGQRSLRVPASWYQKKGDDNRSEVFIHHGIPPDGLRDDDGAPVQGKQRRDGFIVKQDEMTVVTVKVEKSFAIKSAYDRKTRRSADRKMYG